MFQLRDYQMNLQIQIRQCFANGESRVLAVMPTGAGKTVTFADIARRAEARNNRVLILTHRREIQRQTVAKLYEGGVITGQIVSGGIHTFHHKVQVGMVQTVAKRLHKVPKPDLIIIDEAHHLLAKSWQSVVNQWPDVPRIGFTATPERLDGRGLGEDGLFTAMVMGPQIRELVKMGNLAYPVMCRPEREFHAEYHVKRGDYDTKEQEHEFSKKAVIGNVIEHYRDKLDGLPAIGFTPTVETAFRLAEDFTDAGFRAVAVHGSMSDSERDNAIKGLSDGSIQVVFSCDVISEGVDVPVVSGAMLLRRTMSLGLYLQQCGRALRMFPGKDRAYILDHAGNRWIHGHVLEDRQWDLHAEKRKKKPKTDLKITECPKCYDVWPGSPRKCPNCGYSFVEAQYEKKQEEFKVLEGTLKEEHPDLDDEMLQTAARIMSADDGRAKQKRALAQAFEYVKNGEREKLSKLTEALGYKQNWTKVVYEMAQKKGIV